MEIQEFAREYETKTDDELLRLALNSAELIPEANTALNLELSKRQLTHQKLWKAFVMRNSSCKKAVEKTWVSYGLFATYVNRLGGILSGKPSTPTAQKPELSNSNNCLHRPVRQPH